MYVYGILFLIIAILSGVLMGVYPTKDFLETNGSKKQVAAGKVFVFSIGMGVLSLVVVWVMSHIQLPASKNLSAYSYVTTGPGVSVVRGY